MAITVMRQTILQAENILTILDTVTSILYFNGRDRDQNRSPRTISLNYYA